MPDEALTAFRNKHVGFVFQFHHLLPEFTALENAEMPLRIARMHPAESKRRAEAGTPTSWTRRSPDPPAQHAVGR